MTDELFAWQKECVRWRKSQGEGDELTPCDTPCAGCAERSVHQDLPKLMEENARMRAQIQGVREALDEENALELIRALFEEQAQVEELMGSW